MEAEKNNILMRPIGLIRTSFLEGPGTPIQGTFAQAEEGSVEVYPEYAEGLSDLSEFSHVILLYAFHKIVGYSLKVVPYIDTVERGIFAVRSPKRPNAIGITIVKLLSIDNTVLRISGVDMLNNSPLLDIKPYVPLFDHRKNVLCGWLDERLGAEARGNEAIPKIADKRFHL